MKKLISALGLSIFYILSWKVSVEGQQQINRTLSDELVQKGQQLLDQGHPADALQVWQKALTAYQNLGYQEGVRGTLVNQSIAYMRLGEYYNACTNLVNTLEIDPKICISSLNSSVPLQFTHLQLKQIFQKNSDKTLVVAGLQNLGQTLRQLGKLEDSITALHQALETAEQFKVPTEPIILSLANTKQAFFSKNHSIDDEGGDQLSRTKATYAGPENAVEAFQLYDLLSRRSETSFSLIAKINWLSLYSELIEWIGSEDEGQVPSLAKLKELKTPQAKRLIQELSSENYNQTTPINSIFNRLQFSRSILSLASSKSNLIDNNLLLAAFNQTHNAFDISTRLGNQRGKSESLGTIGKFYEFNKQTAQAQDAYEKANASALSVQANDLSYQWQWALGRLSHTSGQTEEAIKYYQAAIKDLEQVRTNLLFVNLELEYKFRKAIEPVYKQYIALLLENPSSNLQTVVNTEESLQLSEVENYLQCGHLNLSPLSKIVSIPNTKNRPSAFYILDLGNRYAVIVTDPSGRQHVYFPNHQRVLDATTRLKIYLEDQRFQTVEPSRFLPLAKILYDELISPAEQEGYLPKHGHLVFSEDNFIQNIPISMLYDGQNYLIEKYSISVALGSGLRMPKKINRDNIQAVFAGLSQKSPSFDLPNVPRGLEPIQDVKQEGSEMAKLLKTTQLLDQNFTWDHLKHLLSPKTQVVQISTHGQFSSDPNQTFLLAWNKTINSLKIRELLRGGMDEPEIELLFLSACETAKGDKRSTLGIAGIAAQAGASSTVATLWQVTSESTPEFIKIFYSNLIQKNPINSKANALQEAQIALIKSENFNHPYYWASFILVGNWQ